MRLAHEARTYWDHIFHDDICMLDAPREYRGAIVAQSTPPPARACRAASGTATGSNYLDISLD